MPNPSQFRTDIDRRRINLPIVFLTIALAGITIYLFGPRMRNYLSESQTAILSIDANNGKLLWFQGLDDDSIGSIAVSDDRVFIATARQGRDRSKQKYQSIEALAAKTGQKLWSIAPPRAGTQEIDDLASPVPMRVAGDRLWINTIDSLKPKIDRSLNSDLLTNIRRGRVLQIDPQTGNIRHSIERDWQIERLNINGIALSTSVTAILRIDRQLKTSLEAYDAGTDKLRWQIPLAATARSTNQAYGRYRLWSEGDTIFVFDLPTRKLSGYDGQTGRSKSQITTSPQLGGETIEANTPIQSYLTTLDRTIYTLESSGRQGMISALDADTGKQQWQYQTAPNRLFYSSRGKGSYTQCVRPASISVTLAAVYLFCESRPNGEGYPSDGVTILALDRQTGKEIWNTHYWEDRWRSPFQPRHFVANSKNIYGVLMEGGHASSSTPSRYRDSLVALSQDRGRDRQRWRWESNYVLHEDTLTIDGDRLFIAATLPRWRLLTGAIDYNIFH